MTKRMRNEQLSKGIEHQEYPSLCDGADLSERLHFSAGAFQSGAGAAVRRDAPDRAGRVGRTDPGRIPDR